MRLSLVLFTILAAAGGYFLYTHHQKSLVEIPDGIYGSNGRTELKRIDVASLYAGRVEEYLVKEGDSVVKGQVIARLKDTRAKGQVKEARSALSAAESGVKAVSEHLVTIDSEIKSLEDRIRLAKIELENARKLRNEKLIGQTELERRISQLTQLNASLETAKSSRAEAEWNLKRTSYQAEQAAASLDIALDAETDMVITAPLDGYVEYTLADPGNVIGAGGRVAALLDPLDFTLDLFVPSKRTANLRIGDEARIVIEGMDAVIPAKISFIAQDAQFTPKFVETAEERARLMFKVTLRVDADVLREYRGAFNGGMPALGYVKYDRNAAWPASLAVKLPAKPEGSR